MKPLGNVDLKSSTLVKISGYVFVSILFFYLGKQWSESDGYRQLVFFTSHQNPNSHSVSLSPNLNSTFNLSSLPNDTGIPASQNVASSVSPPADGVISSSPPPQPVLKRMGVLDENGVMMDDFEVGDIDPDVLENWALGNETEEAPSEGSIREKVRVKKFELCPESMREYIPCMDNLEAISKLNSTEKGEKFERHCPEEGHGLNCLVPAPKGYRKPIPWPRSRDEVIIHLASNDLFSPFRHNRYLE